jgi:hypothetical protein
MHEREGARDPECAANIEYGEFLPNILRSSRHVPSVNLGIRVSELTITGVTSARRR